MTKSRVLITAIVIAALSAGFGTGHLLIGSGSSDSAHAVVAEEATSTTTTEAPSTTADLSAEVDEPTTTEGSSGGGPVQGEKPAEPEPKPLESEVPAEEPVEPEPEPEPEQPAEEANPEPNPPEPEVPVHEVLSGALEPDPDPQPTHPIGEIEPGLVPEGLDFTAFPGAPDEPPTTNVGGPMVISPGPECAYQCISSGVAYPRGCGALLVVETKVPAEIFISVIGDTNGNGDYDFKTFEWSPAKATEFSLALDHLDPGQTYYGMVTATDEYSDTSYAWGDFTTLSKRTIQVRVNEVEIHGGPGNVKSTQALMRAAGEGYPVGIVLGTGEEKPGWYEFGTWSQYNDVDRNIDIDLLVLRHWDRQDPCEGQMPLPTNQKHGQDGVACTAWATASWNVDLDQIPAGPPTWKSVAFATTLLSYEAPPLPPFDVVAPATVNVVYSE